MAQDDNRSGTPHADSSPSAKEVRRALLHLAELAAAYEGRGLDVDEPDSTVEEDQRVLAQVTDLLLKHRKRQRLRQRDALFNALTEALGEDYAKVRDGEIASPNGLRQNIVTLCRELDIEPTAHELSELVIPLEGAAADLDGRPVAITESGGPVDAAKNALSRAVGRSVGTFAKARRDAKVVSLSRHAFARWVPTAVAGAYLMEARDLLGPTNSPPRSVPLRALFDLEETTGLVLDSAVERQSRMLFTTERGLRSILDAEPQGPRTAELKRQFDDVCLATFQAMLRTVDLLDEIPSTAEERLDSLQYIGDRVRAAARALIRARRTPNQEAVAQAEIDLQEAVWFESFESARQDFSKRLAALDSGG